MLLPGDGRHSSPAKANVAVAHGPTDFGAGAANITVIPSVIAMWDAWLRVDPRPRGVIDSRAIPHTVTPAMSAANNHPRSDTNDPFAARTSYDNP
jgi:hypothetical protein